MRESKNRDIKQTYEKYVRNSETVHWFDCSENRRNGKRIIKNIMRRRQRGRE